MKYGQILIAAAVTALAEGLVQTEFAKERVRATKHRLERIYGRNLLGLYHEETGKIVPKRFSLARKNKLSQSSTMVLGGITLHPDDQNTILLGFTKGLQYDGLVAAVDEYAKSAAEEVVSNCFYAAYAMTEDLESITSGWEALNPDSNNMEYNWFDPLVYGPLHLIGDFSVTFEHCDSQAYLAQISNLASLDWGAIGDRVSSIGVDAFMNWQQYADTYSAALGWYIPKTPQTCAQDDFKTGAGAFDSDKYGKCLEEQAEQQAEYDIWKEWAPRCVTLYGYQESQKLLDQQALEEAEAKANGEEAFSLEGFFGSLFGGDTATETETLQADLTEGGIDFEDPELIEMCGKYGKLADTDYYEIGKFAGQMISKIFDTTLVANTI